MNGRMKHERVYRSFAFIQRHSSVATWWFGPAANASITWQMPFHFGFSLCFVTTSLTHLTTVSRETSETAGIGCAAPVT